MSINFTDEEAKKAFEIVRASAHSPSGVTRFALVSSGVSVSRLLDGRIVLSAHKDSVGVAIELSPTDCEHLAALLLANETGRNV